MTELSEDDRRRWNALLDRIEQAKLDLADHVVDAARRQDQLVRAITETERQLQDLGSTIARERGYTEVTITRDGKVEGR